MLVVLSVCVYIGKCNVSFFSSTSGGIENRTHRGGFYVRRSKGLRARGRGSVLFGVGWRGGRASALFDYV